MEIATASLDRQKYATLIRARQHQLTADEPVDLNGTDTGFTPNELLCASLAGCTAITLRMFADRKEWPLESIKVSVTLQETEDRSKNTFERTVKLSGTLTEEQLQRLLQVANACPVHKLLNGQISVNTKLTHL